MALRLVSLVTQLRLWKDTHGQDMIEYALVAGTVCLMYAAVSPSVATSVSSIFSKIASDLSAASATS